MAALLGRIQGSRGPVTRLGHQTIDAKLETWHGAIAVELHADGCFSVYIGPKSVPASLIAQGNVNEGKRHANLIPPRSI